MAINSQLVGTVGKSIFASDSTLGNNNAGFHNSIYRGKSLGTSVTADQYSQISAGTFNDMFIGDYWTISSKVYRIAAFDYWYNVGSTACTTHHVVLVPDASLTTSPMNSTNTTATSARARATFTAR